MANLKQDERGQNDLNVQLHSQPWYQDFLRTSGQNPTRVHLSDQQRHTLEALAAQHGVTLPSGVQFDPSGNVNEQHGFAGQPGWLKGLEIAGALAPAAIFGAPALAGAFGAGGGGGAAAGGGLAASVGAPAATEAGIFGAAGAGGAAASTGGILGGLSAAGRLAGGVLGTRAQNRAAEADYGLASDRTALSAANLRMGAEGGRERQLIGADLTSSMKPPTDPRAQPFLSGSTVSPDTIALIRQRAQGALASGSDVPTMSTMPKPGKTDSILNALNYAGTGLDALKFLKGGR